MDHKRLRTRILPILFFSVLFLRCSAVAAVQKEPSTGADEVADMDTRTTIIEAVKSLFSLPTAFPKATDSYWTKLKTLIKQSCAPYFSSPSPNLDFRGDDQERSAEGEEDGTAEKVKEAVAKSLDKSKYTVEESAKSAAKIAGHAMEKTAKKVKRTLSGDGADHEPEL